MDLGISTYTYGWAFDTNGGSHTASYDEYDLIEKAGSFAVSLLQIGDNLPLHSFSAARLGALKRTLHEKNITLEIGAKGMTTENLHRYILICKNAGARLLRFVTDAEKYNPSAETLIGTIQSQVPLLEELDIVLAIENHDRLRTKELARIMDAVDSSRVGVCLDTVNSLGTGEGIEAVRDTLAPYTVNLHLKDFGISRLTHQQGFRVDGRIAGEGMLKRPFLLSLMASCKKCRTCILEQWVPPEKTMEETIAKESAWAEKSMEYLKQIWETPSLVKYTT